ncbi:S-layer homology domain-containing protein [uncultured Intestinimonas sp.]
MAWAVDQGITSGTGEGAFSPDNTCTRGEIVTFLYRGLGQ